MNIVIIDDNIDILEMTRFMLESTYNCLCFESYQCALNFIILNARHVDFILCDNYLGEQRGEKLLETIKTRFPHIKAAIMTAGIEDESSFKHIDGFIQKPFMEEGIKNFIQETMKGR